MLRGEDADHVERVAAQFRRCVGRSGDRVLQYFPALCEVAVDLPEAPNAHDEPERRRLLAGVVREGQRRADVVVLVLEPGEPRDLFRAPG